MALSEIVAAIVDVCRTVPGSVSVPDAPPGQLADDRMLIVYPQPGPSVAAQHTGRANTGPVIRNDDAIIVEWHLKRSADVIAESVPEMTEMTDALRDALWGAFARTRFGGTVIGMTSIETDRFGELGWGSDFTFGVRLLLNITHAAELAAGKA